MFKDTTGDFLTNSLVGYTMLSAAGELRIIVANDSTSWTINRAFDTLPVIGDAYEIYSAVFSTNMGVPSLNDITYGRDIMLRFDGSMGVEGSAIGVLSQSGDCATIGGIENYIQNLSLMLSTEQGFLALHPYWGNPQLVGQRATVNELQFYKMLIQRAVLMDKRALSVDKVSLVAVGDQVYPVITIKPISGQAQTATVPS